VERSAELEDLMRLMSFHLTTTQVQARRKTVTRRIGWSTLAPGTVVQAIEKGQGLRKGESVNRLATLEIIDVRRERLDALVRDEAYGARELELEGFGVGILAPLGLIGPTTAAEFLDMFCQANHCDAFTYVTRIEFRYLDGGRGNELSCRPAGDRPAKEGA
jgi:hypothetical protein